MFRSFTDAHCSYRNQPTQTQKPKTRRTRVFGYLLLEDWIKDFVAKKGLGPPDLDIIRMTSAVGTYVMRESLIGWLAVVKWGGAR